MTPQRETDMEILCRLVGPRIRDRDSLQSAGYAIATLAEEGSDKLREVLITYLEHDGLDEDWLHVVLARNMDMTQRDRQVLITLAGHYTVPKGYMNSDEWHFDLSRKDGGKLPPEVVSKRPRLERAAYAVWLAMHDHATTRYIVNGKELPRD
ncbi:MAG: hypothetical protein AAGF47_05630 [Planctomycetota bacterium]